MIPPRIAEKCRTNFHRSREGEHDLNIKFTEPVLDGTFQFDFTGQDVFVITQPYEELQPEQSDASNNTTNHE